MRHTDKRPDKLWRNAEMVNKLNKRMLAIQIALVATAALFIVYGVYREEVDIVLNKAINICFECIGLG